MLLEEVTKILKAMGKQKGVQMVHSIKNTVDKSRALSVVKEARETPTGQAQPQTRTPVEAKATRKKKFMGGWSKSSS